MKQRGATVPLTIAVVFGAALWFIASALVGKREAWDASAYWALAYPAAILVSGLLGYLYPERPWRWAIALFEAQALAMGIRNGELGNLFPLGMVLFAAIAVPGVVAATLASRRSRRLEEEEA
jgi:peptidoglycan/LPS O-acetylase OafA/YrhL